jgi:hypothetical protein
LVRSTNSSSSSPPASEPVAGREAGEGEASDGAYGGPSSESWLLPSSDTVARRAGRPCQVPRGGGEVGRHGREVVRCGGAALHPGEVALGGGGGVARGSGEGVVLSIVSVARGRRELGGSWCVGCLLLQLLLFFLESRDFII